jgi:hypothetical protein
MKNLDLDSGARPETRSWQDKEELNLEPMLANMSPNIASGDTPIGSAERAPDKDEISNITDTEGPTNKNFDYIVDELSLRLKNFGR